MGEVAEVLLKAKALIEKGWSQPMCMRTELEETNPDFSFRMFQLLGRRMEWPRDVVCDGADPRANKFTLCDAIERAAGNVELALRVEEFLRPYTAKMSAMLWADEEDRTKAQVLELLSKAYGRAKKLTAEDEDRLLNLR